MYGFREVMNLYQTVDNYRIQKSDIDKMFTILDTLPQQNTTQLYEVKFMLGELMVTEGTISKETGSGRVFGFNSKTKQWIETQVEVATFSFVRNFSHGNIVIDDNGNATGARNATLCELTPSRSEN